MPEGDTIRRAADRLRPILVGERVLAFRSGLLHLADVDLVGREVSGVEPLGKHLFVHFDDGRSLRTHLRMKGRWRVLAAGSPIHDGPALSCALETRRGVALCTMAALVELARGRIDDVRAALGPDLLAGSPVASGAPEDGPAAFSPEAAATRLAADPRPLGEALLDQRVVAGIGNVYKSEVLFLARLDPFRPAREVPVERLVDLLVRCRRLMLENLGPHRRRTQPVERGVRYAVYRRSGDHCLVCGGPIRMARQGALGRSTYYCPRCQR